MSSAGTWLARLLGRRQPPPDHPAAPAPGLTRDHVVWAYRLLLDREPESDYVIESKMRLGDTRRLRAELVTSAEYAEKNPDFAQSNEPNLVIKELPDGVRLVVDLSDHAIGLNVIRGRFEQNELDFARSVVRPGDHVVDCGAHIGLFAIHLAAWVGATGSVHAFEPFESNARCLEQSIAENGFQNRVILQRAAVGAAEGTAALVFAAHALNSGGAFILRDGAAPPPGHETVPVPVIALDSLRLNRPIRFIKMDIEGAEPLAVHGAERLLREDRPIVLSEVHPGQLRTVSGVTGDEYLSRMRALGYECFTLMAGGAIGGKLERVPDVDVMSVVFKSGAILNTLASP